jgi:hypothetical protein
VVLFARITFSLEVFVLSNAFQDYLFSLLTGYVDPPAGVELRDGMNYNPYFPGGAISMPRVLFDDLVEYDDGIYLCSFFVPLLLNAIAPQAHPRRAPKWRRTLLLS